MRLFAGLTESFYHIRLDTHAVAGNIQSLILGEKFGQLHLRKQDQIRAVFGGLIDSPHTFFQIFCHAARVGHLSHR